MKISNQMRVFLCIFLHNVKQHIFYPFILARSNFFASFFLSVFLLFTFLY